MADTVTISDEDSILQSIKMLLGPGVEQTEFDQDILMDINGVFFELQELGVGPEEGFAIYDETAKWIDFTDNTKILRVLKPYMYLKVKLIFDPPTSSSVLKSFENMVDRFEWRINVAAESPGSTGEEEIQNG